MKSLTEHKKDARKIAFANRKEAFDSGLDVEANAHLKVLLASFANVEVVAAYMPIRTEVSPLETMAWLVDQGKTVCVPVIKGEGQALLFNEWTPNSTMIDGPFGATIPQEAKTVLPDVVITPLVGFDDHGHRLGYGGGFYDRSFEELLAKKPVRAVGFAFAAQKLEKIPTEKTDHKLDWMVTEEGVQEF